MIWLHCWKCRLLSTPSGRRLLLFPEATGEAAVAAVCRETQAEQLRIAQSVTGGLA